MLLLNINLHIVTMTLVRGRFLLLLEPSGHILFSYMFLLIFFSNFCIVFCYFPTGHKTFLDGITIEGDLNVTGNVNGESLADMDDQVWHAQSVSTMPCLIEVALQFLANCVRIQ